MKARENHRARRIAIAVVVVAAVVSLIALVVPNVLLRSDFIRSRVNKDPEGSWLEYDSAFSRWPGSVTVKNLRFRDRDPKAEWAFALDEVELTYSLADLFRRKFHATRGSGRGLVFHARNRLTPAQATPSRLRRLPPIAGFPDPPLLGPPKPKPTVAGKEWSIQVDRLAVDAVRELWIDGYRYTGEARITGGFFLRPKQRAEVFPTKLATRNGSLRSGRDVLAMDVRATISARITPWDPREFRGSRMLRFITGDAEATARLDDAEVVNHLLGEPAGTRLERGSGRMNVRASVEEGIAKGEIDYSARDLALRALDVAMRGRFDARMQLSGVNIRNWGGGRLSGGHVNLTNATAWDRDGRAHPWWGRVDFEPGGAFRPRSAALFTTSATARARDARPLLQIVNVDLPDWVERLLHLDEELRARASIRLGKSLVELRRLTARTGRLRIYGDYTARSSKSGTFLFDAGLLSVGVGVSEGDAGVRIFGPRKWFRERTGWEPGSTLND